MLINETKNPRTKSRVSLRDVWYLSLAGPMRLELATSGLTEQSLLAVYHYNIQLSVSRSFCVPQIRFPF